MSVDKMKNLSFKVFVLRTVNHFIHLKPTIVFDFKYVLMQPGHNIFTEVSLFFFFCQNHLISNIS